MTAAAKKTTRQFRADVSQVLKLVINSLYSHREIFLRELISNASDALDKLNFKGIEQPSLLKGDEPLEIRLTVDEEGVLRINARAGGLDLLPGRSSSEVFTPPRERPALLWSDLVNVALFVLVQMDANAVVFPALQNIAAVVGLPSVPLEPCFD